MKTGIRKSCCRFLFLLLLAGAMAVPMLHADIYMYIGSDGVLHFSNVPTSSQYRLYIKERPARDATGDAPSRYDRLIREAAAAHGVSPALIKAVIKAESNFDPSAVSGKGAKGLMQIMPENFNQLDIADPFDPRQNIMGGVRYFKRLHLRYAGKLPLVLAAYNAGPTVVDQYNDIPPYPETQAYVEKVMKYYYAYGR
ncbi:MAG: transglycosylase SLT domain-containing protein [Pseudomonadota bacterium]